VWYNTVKDLEAIRLCMAPAEGTGLSLCVGPVRPEHGQDDTDHQGDQAVRKVPCSPSQGFTGSGANGLRHCPDGSTANLDGHRRLEPGFVRRIHVKTLYTRSRLGHLPGLSPIATGLYDATPLAQSGIAIIAQSCDRFLVDSR